MYTTKGTEEKTMRFIDKTGCTSGFEKGTDSEIRSLGKLTGTATKIAEENGLGVLKNRQGAYRIIKKSGLGAYEDFLTSLAEVDTFFKNLDEHESTRY
jgi:hypothetical protein